MDELRIIWKKLPTFTCRNIIGVGTVLAPMLNEYRDKALSDIPAMVWIIIVVACAVAFGNTTLAWFSTSATKAREQIAAEVVK